jgi:murein DD-endopeptidase MepM/ murein hydrolase activator NlpD
MQFIILNNHHGAGRRVRLGPFLCLSVLLGSFLVAAAVFAGGMYFAHLKHERSWANLHSVSGLAWQHEMQQQRDTLEYAKVNASQQLNVLAARLSQLQGHVLRLDALGARLAAMAELDDFEFGLEHPPGMGGPAPSVQDDTSVHDFIDALDRMTLELDARADKLAAMERLLLNRNLREHIVPAGVPVKSGWVSSLYGMRTNPISGRREAHEGMDFAGRPGTKILSVADGVVTWAGRRGGYGNLVEISHGDGYVTRYAHNKENLVSVGERVAKGQPIALMGSTGRSTGTHVHFEVLHDGKSVNPKNYISVK